MFALGITMRSDAGLYHIYTRLITTTEVVSLVSLVSITFACIHISRSSYLL